MGLFSSKSSSSSLSTSTVNNTSIDKRVVADNGGIGVSGDTVTLHVLDGGAIAQAFDFAKHTDQESRKTLADALGWAEKGLGQIAQAYDAARGEATQKNMIAAAALAAVAVVAIKVWAK